MAEEIPIVEEVFGRDSIQAKIVEVVETIEETRGKAHTPDVAAVLALSHRQTQRYLVELVEAGFVQRVGQRGGWRCAA